MAIAINSNKSYPYDSCLIKNSRKYSLEFSQFTFGSAEDSQENESLPFVRKEIDRSDIFERFAVSGNNVIRRASYEFISEPQSILDSDLEKIGLTSFEISGIESRLVEASYLKTSDEEDPVVQISYGLENDRKIYHVHVNEVDTKNASDMEMFALLSYKGFRGERVPDSINNYEAYKLMKIEAGYDSMSSGEREFIDGIVNVEELFKGIYDMLRNAQNAELKIHLRMYESLMHIIKK